MATNNKSFRVRHGLDVNSNATVDTSGNANITGNLTANTGFISADTFRLDTTYTGGSSQAGEMAWDPDNETAQLQLDAHTIIQIGQEQVVRVKNADAVNAIPIRTAVMFAGAAGDTVTVAPANSANVSVTPSDYLVGITAEEIPADGFGFVTQFGTLPNVNTAAFTLGNLLYVDPVNPGQFVTTRPTAPAWQTPIGAVTKVASGSGGRILVRAIPGIRIGNVEGVEITSPATNDIFRVNANGIVVNSSLAVANIANLAATGLQTFSGNIAGTNFAATGNVNAATVNVTGQLISTQATGTAPLSVASTTMVQNLTAQVATRVNTLAQFSIGGDPNTAAFITYVDSNNVVSADEALRTDSGLMYYPLTDTLQASVFNGSGAQLTNIPNSATTAASANGASTIVARDANGSFTANVITGTTFVGSATSAAAASTATSLGYMGMPQVAVSSGGRNLLAADAGKHIYLTGAAQTVLIPANSNIAYEIGTTIVLINGSANVMTVSITTDTLTLAGIGTTGSRSLAASGMATLVKVTSTNWFISGNGLS